MLYFVIQWSVCAELEKVKHTDMYYTCINAATMGQQRHSTVEGETAQNK